VKARVLIDSEDETRFILILVLGDLAQEQFYIDSILIAKYEGILY